MINDQEQLVTLSFARQQLIPRSASGRAINLSTIHRWIRRGLEGRDGERIRLEAVYRGQTPVTSAEAVSRFFEAVTTAKLAIRNRKADVYGPATTEELKKNGLV